MMLEFGVWGSKVAGGLGERVHGPSVVQGRSRGRGVWGSPPEVEAF